MKDLKYLYEFEKLLESANNPLVQQACAEGKHALAYTCYHMPEVLLNTGDCFSVRLRAPLTGSLDISSYYMSNFICDYCKSLLERGIEGGYNFLSALLATETCSEMNRALEHFELLHIVDNEQFFVTFLDMPFKVTDNTVRHYVDQLRRKVLEPLHEVYGVDVSDDALRKAVAEHNEVCRILTEIGQLRKEENPRITGYEYHILNLVSYCCPKYLIVDKLRETLEELRHREPDARPNFRVKIAVVGSEIDDPGSTKLVEEAGALVVVDRFCFGSTPGRRKFISTLDLPVLESIARHYLTTSQCPRYMQREKVEGRWQLVRDLCKEYHAQGVLYEQLKFCEYWGYERALASHVITHDYGIPSVAVDRQNAHRRQRPAAHARAGIRRESGDQAAPGAERRQVTMADKEKRSCGNFSATSMTILTASTPRRASFATASCAACATRRSISTCGSSAGRTWSPLWPSVRCRPCARCFATSGLRPI
ncbi:MAG: 2-hydroxyacyl-CoA dehydratase family protein [Oscillospiraceae bacterium]